MRTLGDILNERLAEITAARKADFAWALARSEREEAAIEAFLKLMEDEYDICFSGYQVGAEEREQPERHQPIIRYWITVELSSTLALECGLLHDRRPIVHEDPEWELVNAWVPVRAGTRVQRAELADALIWLTEGRPIDATTSSCTTAPALADQLIYSEE